MRIKSHQDLIVWRKGMQLGSIIYSSTNSFPKTEAYGLSSQMQRAAVGRPSNIAEGYQRNRTFEYVRFLGIAYASAGELETQLLIAQEQYREINYDQSMALVGEIQRCFTPL